MIPRRFVRSRCCIKHPNMCNVAHNPIVLLSSSAPWIWLQWRAPRRPVTTTGATALTRIALFLLARAHLEACPTPFSTVCTEAAGWMVRGGTRAECRGLAARCIGVIGDGDGRSAYLMLHRCAFYAAEERNKHRETAHPRHLLHQVLRRCRQVELATSLRVPW